MAQDNTAGLATMLSFLQQGSNPGEDPPLPEMKAPPPLPEINLPDPQKRGGGVLSGILGNLASSYVSNKLKTHMAKQNAEEEGKALREGILSHADSLGSDNAVGKYMRAVAKNPLTVSGVKSMQHGYQKAMDTLAGNETQTAEYKNVINPITHGEIIRKENKGGTPSGWTRDENGVLTPDTTNTGGNYADFLTQQNLNRRFAISPQQQHGMDAQEVSNQRSQNQLEETMRHNRIMEIKGQQAADRADAKANEALLGNMAPTHRQVWGKNNTAVQNIDKYLGELGYSQDKTGEWVINSDAYGKNDKHFGLHNLMPHLGVQKIDPEGTKLRATVGKISSVEMADTSGKTITPNEMQRLDFTAPSINDDLKVVKDKLLTMRDFALGNKKGVEQMYDSKGYKNLPWDSSTIPSNKSAPKPSVIESNNPNENIPESQATPNEEEIFKHFPKDAPIGSMYKDYVKTDKGITQVKPGDTVIINGKTHRVEE